MVSSAIQYVLRAFAFGAREGTVVQTVWIVHPEVRSVLVAEGRAFLDWDSCRVRDYVGAVRCFRVPQLRAHTKDAASWR